MKLLYYKGGNFGDSLNPYIFENFLPNFFKKDDGIDFIGIGSILDFDMTHQQRKKVVFSSGFAYGKYPKLDDSFDVICVRGPLTAKYLKINPDLAIADGAILLKYMYKGSLEKIYNFSFMPHHSSELKFNWKRICEECGIHYISPSQDYRKSITEIRMSKILISEAMHGAIVADTFRVPWIPVKAYRTINSFKWNDWLLGMGMNYHPQKLMTLVENNQFIQEIYKKNFSLLMPNKCFTELLENYVLFQNRYILPRVINVFEKIKKLEPSLTEDKILEEKGEQLLEKINLVKLKYK